MFFYSLVCKWSEEYSVKMKKKVLQILVIGGVFLSLTGCHAKSGQPKAQGVSAETVRQTVEEPVKEEIPAEPYASSAGPYLVENPKDGYNQTGEEKAASEPAFELRLMLEQENEITDAEAWFSENDLSIPSFPYTDENYEYQVDGENSYSPFYLDLFDLNKDKTEIKLDFSEYRYADDFAEENREYAEQRILWAKAEEGVLYVSLAHNTYAHLSPHTAYITAIDLSEKSVIWKSEALVCNSKTFEIIGDSIVCGYGFTEEADYLYVLDKRNGKVQEQIPLKTQPEYIIRRENVLYVRTYHTNYRFEIADTRNEQTKAAEQNSYLESYDGSFEKEIKLAKTNIRFRMTVMDAALGSRLYGLIKSRDDGITWEVVSLDPFGSNTGMGIEFTFLNETFGFAVLEKNGGDSAELWVTEDGGSSYQRAVLEEYLVTLAQGYCYAPFDFPQMPYEEDGLVYVLCGQGADGDYNGGDSSILARYCSADHGHTFSFDRIVNTA